MWIYYWCLERRELLFVKCTVWLISVFTLLGMGLSPSFSIGPGIVLHLDSPLKRSQNYPYMHRQVCRVSVWVLGFPLRCFLGPPVYIKFNFLHVQFKQNTIKWENILIIKAHVKSLMAQLQRIWNSLASSRSYSAIAFNS